MFVTLNMAPLHVLFPHRRLVKLYDKRTIALSISFYRYQVADLPIVDAPLNPQSSLTPSSLLKKVLKSLIFQRYFLGASSLIFQRYFLGAS